MPERLPDDTVRSLFGVTDVSEITDRKTDGAVDVVNGVVSPAPDNRTSPVHVTLNDGVAIQGWMVMGSVKSGRPFDEVYAVVNGLAVKASITDRSDVGAYFKNPDIGMCGYRVRLWPSRLREGLQAVDFVGIDRAHSKFVRFQTSTFIFAERHN